MFILTEPTPNPDAMKFTPGIQLTVSRACGFARADFDPRQSPLAGRLLAIADVAGVYIDPAFVTVTRSSGGRPWGELRRDAIAAISDHLESGDLAVARCVRQDEAPAPSAIAEEDDIEAEIRNVLDHWVRPGVARDGGDVLFDRFDAATGVLWIRMRGACGGCPSSPLTLKAGIERTVRRYVPEVLHVQDAAADDEPASPSRLKAWIAKLNTPTGSPIRTIFTHANQRILKNSDAMQTAEPVLRS